MVQHLHGHGYCATCRAEFTGGWDRGGGDTGSIGVVLHITDDLALMDPTRHPLLPSTKKVATVGEEHHQEELRAFMKDDKPTMVMTTLELEAGVVHILLGGQRVSRLTPKMSERYLPVIEGIAAAGLPCSCQAKLTLGASKRELDVYLPTPDELDESVL